MIETSMNGLLAGLVASTAGCALVEPYISFVIGVISGLVYLGGSWLLLWLKIDDPLDSAPIHLGGGAWGILANGLFATRQRVTTMLGRPTDVYGLFYGGGAEQLGIQVLGIVMVIAWCISLSGIFFYILKRKDLLRIDAESELVGIDHVDHGGSAYPDFQHL